MSNWQKIQQAKLVYSDLHRELNELKKLQPSEANARRILEIEKRIRMTRISIQVMKRSYGFAA